MFNDDYVRLVLEPLSYCLLISINMASTFLGDIITLSLLFPIFRLAVVTVAAVVVAYCRFENKLDVFLATAFSMTFLLSAGFYLVASLELLL